MTVLVFCAHAANLPSMQWIKTACIFMGLWLGGLAVDAAQGQVIKVLPHYLNLEGKHALSPSLYERDAYQAVLRKNPQQRSGVRFDIQWKAREAAGRSLTLRLEIRSGKSNPTTPLVIVKPVQTKRWHSHWTPITLDGETYQKLGEIIAWRVTLWDGGRPLGEQRSFLW